MKKTRPMFYIIERETLDELGVAPVLDMLRYDSAIVESNAPPGFYLLRIDDGHAPHVARWASFGVRIGLEHCSDSAGELADYARNVRKAKS